MSSNVIEYFSQLVDRFPKKYKDLKESIENGKVKDFNKYVMDISVDELNNDLEIILLSIFNKKHGLAGDYSLITISKPKYSKIVEMVKILLDKSQGSNLIKNKYVKNGWNNILKVTLLHIVCKILPDDVVIKKLIERGADINALDNDSKSVQKNALHYAANYGNPKAIKALVDSGSDINAGPDASPLHFACSNGDNEVAKTLVKLGADINVKDSNDATPLHYVSKLFNLELLKFFRDNGADLNAVDKMGQTALHYTTANSYINIIGYENRYRWVNHPYINNSRLVNHEGNVMAAVLLIKYGIDKNIKDINGKTAFENGHVTSYEKNVKDPQGVYVGSTIFYGVQQIMAELINKKLNKGPKLSQMFNYSSEPDIHVFDPLREIVHGDSQSVLDKMTSIIKYTDENNVKFDVPIITIPKGVLLFRSIRGDDEADYCGIKLNPTSNKHCLHKNHNVFFYPYPGFSDKYAVNHKISCFVVEREMKLLNLRNPAAIHRANKDDKDIYFRDCHNVEKNFCYGLVGRSYDPCFTEHFIRKNPDVVGMITLAKADTVHSHRKPYQFGTVSKYSVFSQDSRKVQGIPEFILYPLETRNLKEIHWDLDECKKKGKKNYSEFFETRDSDQRVHNIFAKLEKFLSPQGFQKKHATIFNPLKMFVIYEKLEDKYKKDCVPLIFDATSKLATFQTDINKLNQPLYSKGRHIKTHAAQMKEIDTFDQEQKPRNEKFKMSTIQDLPSKMEEGSPDDNVYTVKGNVQIKSDSKSKPSAPQTTSTRSNRPVNTNNKTQKATSVTQSNSKTVGINVSASKASASKKMGQDCDNDTDCFTKLCVYNNITKKKKCKPTGKYKRIVGDECNSNQNCYTRKCADGYCAKN
jgi:ankyrin repeat protein